MPDEKNYKTRRIGIDLGGTKIEGIVLDPDGHEIARQRIPTPQNDYDATIRAVAGLTHHLNSSHTETNTRATIGIAMPGSMSPATNRVQNANSTWLNGKRFNDDIGEAVGQNVRVANDANCFALSEAVDGAGADVKSVFGIIIGTGVGGGLVVAQSIIDGPRSIGGEWGHNPLPWAQTHEQPGPKCWCGRSGCMEAWTSGPAVSTDHERTTGQSLSCEEIVKAANTGDVACRATLSRHASRLARGIAHVVNIFDPEVIVLGGGLSNMSHLYDELPDLIAPHLFTDAPHIDIRPPKWGDAGGCRGAAWLWPASSHSPPMQKT